MQRAQLFYDSVSDVLYLSVGEPREATSREIGADVLLRLDPNSAEVIGLTILNLSARFGNLDVPQNLSRHLSVTPT